MLINNEWKLLLNHEFSKDYFLDLEQFLENEYNSKIIFPEYNKIFTAFNLTKPSEVKVVIIGQDPYHGVNQANGLAFSVRHGTKNPPSLVNIFKELVSDIGCAYPESGDLSPWASQGVLLINSVLTVESSKPNSHSSRGWEIFSDKVIKILSHKYKKIVFILWGNSSQKKSSLIDNTKHLIIKAPHPSPLSAYRGFFGSKPFSKANDYLIKHKKSPINWNLNE